MGEKPLDSGRDIEEPVGQVLRIPTTVPSDKEEIAVQRAISWVAPVFRLGAWLRLGGVELRNAHHLPVGTPALFLCNHVGMLDPAIAVASLGRPVHFMATQSLWMHPFYGRVMNLFGIVPKKKFSADFNAIRMLRKWADIGATVGLYPEGERTWDGRPLPLVDGIGGLVRMLGIPVVTARVINGYRVWPRWAATPRRGLQVLELDPPMEFERRAKDAVIVDHLRARLSVDAETGESFPVRGTNLAGGLRNLLFLCPACGQHECLREEGDTLRCSLCAASWVLGTDLWLRAAKEEQSLTIAQAADRERSWLAERDFVAEPERFARDGVIVESEPCRVLDIGGDRSTEVARGRLRLYADRLEVPETGWCLPLDKVNAITVDRTRSLQIRSADSLFAPDIKVGSVLKWDWIGNHWRRKLVVRAVRPGAEAAREV